MLGLLHWIFDFVDGFDVFETHSALPFTVKHWFILWLINFLMRLVCGTKWLKCTTKFLMSSILDTTTQVVRSFAWFVTATNCCICLVTVGTSKSLSASPFFDYIFGKKSFNSFVIFTVLIESRSEKKAIVMSRINFHFVLFSFYGVAILIKWS